MGLFKKKIVTKTYDKENILEKHVCMIMAVYSGHKMISGNKRTRKQMEVKEVEE